MRIAILIQNGTRKQLRKMPHKARDKVVATLKEGINMRYSYSYSLSDRQIDELLQQLQKNVEKANSVLRMYGQYIPLKIRDTRKNGKIIIFFEATLE